MATVVETAILLEFINKLLGSRFNGAKNILQFVLSFVIINCYMVAIGFISVKYSALLDLGGILLYEIYAVIFMKKDLIYRFITPILSIMSIFVLNIIISIVASYVFKSEPNELLNDRDLLRISMLFITKFSFFILTRIVLKIAKPKDVLLDKQELTAVSLIFIISIIIIGYSGEIYYSSGRNSTISRFLIILLIGLIVINVTVFTLFLIIAKNNRDKLRLSMMKMQYELQKGSYDSIQTVYSNLQTLQHDLKNQLLCVYNLIEKNQNDEAKKYISEFADTKLSQFHEYIKTGNEIIDTIINVKLNFAREKNIDIVCKINADFHGFKENDIVCLFSNAIDNAIESCLKQKKGRIKVNIENKRNYLCITIGNTIISSVLKNNSKLKTTKRDYEHHGLGTQSMKNITEKYDGMIEFYETGSMFVTNIMVKCFEYIPNTK